MSASAPSEFHARKPAPVVFPGARYDRVLRAAGARTSSGHRIAGASRQPARGSPSVALFPKPALHAPPHHQAQRRGPERPARSYNYPPLAEVGSTSPTPAGGPPLRSFRRSCAFTEALRASSSSNSSGNGRGMLGHALGPGLQTVVLENLRRGQRPHVGMVHPRIVQGGRRSRGSSSSTSRSAAAAGFRWSSTKPD